MGLGLGGNKSKKKKKNKSKEDLYKNKAPYSNEDDIFGEEDEFAEYDAEIKNGQQNSSNENSLYDDENTIDNQEQKKGKKNIGLIIIIGIITAIVFAFVIFMIGLLFFNNKQEKAKVDDNQSQVTITSDNDTSKDSDSKTEGDSKKSSDEKKDVRAGIPDLHNNTKMTNNDKPTDPKDFMKDIKGDEIPKAYTVVRIENVSDFVNYTKKRAIMGDGVELYWLEATYKGQPYVITVPYQMFKEMDDSGITVVNVEVLHLKDGHTVVSYMSVNPDARKILQQAGKK